MNKHVAISSLVCLFLTVLLAGCGVNNRIVTTSTTTDNQTLITSLPPVSPSPVTSPLTTGVTVNPTPTAFVYQHPQLSIPGGTSLSFETVEVDRLPIASKSRHKDFVWGFIDEKPTISYNNELLYDLYPETQEKLLNIDYSRYFVLMVFQGHRNYDEPGIMITKVVQDPSTITCVVDTGGDNSPICELPTTPYHIIALDKLQFTHSGPTLISIIDTTGLQKGITGYMIPGSGPPSSINRTESDALTVCILDLPELVEPGETAEVVFTIHDRGGIKESDVWLEFYRTNIEGSYLESKYAVPIDPDTLLTGGQASWVVQSSDNETLKLHTWVQFPEEGFWEVWGFYTNDSGILWKAYRPTVVTTDDPGIVKEKIGNMRGDKGYGINPSRLVYQEPVLMSLDLPRLPQAGEEVTLTCRFVSLHADIPHFITHITLWERVREQLDEEGYEFVVKQIDTPPEDYYVSGILLWEGSLKQNVPVEFSAVIKIPHHGEWQLYAGGDSVPENHGFGNYGRSDYRDAITLSCTGEFTCFGYPERYPTTSPSTGRSQSYRYEYEATWSYPPESIMNTLPTTPVTFLPPPTLPEPTPPPPPTSSR